MENHINGASFNRYLTYTDNVQWVQIQKNTFTNWLNEQLKKRGVEIRDLRTDFKDGTDFVALVEVLTGRKIPAAIKNPSNEYEKIENITLALEAISRDGVRIVNIGSRDVTEGNLKLVLALIWQLILRYQIGLSAVQHRHWILKWLKAVIPECVVTNFTTDWNDGLALNALLDFCKPGIFADWRRLNRDDRLNNCRIGMKLARQHFGIPLILRPEDLASPELDERSAITYLSYFIKVGGPGYNATLNHVQKRVLCKKLSNFTTDWHDGRAMCDLIRNSGGSIPQITGSSIDLLRQAMNTGKRLGVDHILTPEEIVEENHEHLGIMTYTAQFLSFSPVTYYQTNMSRNVMLYDDESSSLHTSTLTSPSLSPSFHLVGKVSDDFPLQRVDESPSDTYKLDVYSVGVIINSKIPQPFDPELIRVEAEAPSGRVIKITGDGHYSAQFTSSEIGVWKVGLFYNNRKIDGCPIDVCDPSQVRVLDLRGGVVCRPQEFKVDCSRAGNGKLGVDITYKGRRVPTHIRKSSSGIHSINYTPYDPGPYEINVHFNGAEVRDADFHSSDPEDRQRKAVFCTEVDYEGGYAKIKSTCDWEIDYMTGGAFVSHVTDSSDIHVYGMQDGTICSTPELIADCTKVGDGLLEAEVTNEGRHLPTKVTPDKPGVYRIAFRPRGPGLYKVWVKFDGVPVKGSPFLQEIAELQAPSARGEGLKRARVDKPATFVVDPRGFPGTVSVNVQGPTQPIKSNIAADQDGTYQVHYTPVEIGHHNVDVRVDNKPVEGSPFIPYAYDPSKVRVSGGWRPFVDENGIIPLVVDKEKHIPFDASEAGPGELTSEVRGPRGKIPVAVDTRNDGRNTVIFTPREEGKHYIDVFWSGFPLINSPYVGHARQEPKEDGYRLVEIPLRNSHPQSTRSSTIGSNPEVSIYDSEVPDRRRNMTPTPLAIVTRNDSPDGPEIQSSKQFRGPLKVILSGHGLKEAQVGKEAQFKVDGTKAGDGVTQAEMNSMRASIPIKITPLGPRVYRCTYVPEVPGAYLLHVKWNGQSLKGSPYRVSVRQQANAKKVKIIAPGMKDGVVPGQIGKDIDIVIDPREAGQGQLTVKCTDPNGQELPTNMTTNSDGTVKLKIIPKMMGRHILEIRYSGEHVLGSPYAIDVKGTQATTGVVKAWGPGISNGVLSDFASHFWVDATGAGAGELRVRVMGPKGAFNVKMRKASQSEKVYQCFYDPREPGIYNIEISWSGVHILGSPYSIMLAANPSDLERMEDIRSSRRVSSFGSYPLYYTHSGDGRDPVYYTRSTDGRDSVYYTRSTDGRDSVYYPRSIDGRDSVYYARSSDGRDVLY